MRLVRVGSENLKRGPQLRQRLTARFLDRFHGLSYPVRCFLGSGARLGAALLVQQVQCHSSLHGDHGKAVTYHVMYVTCDPQPFFVGVTTSLLLPDLSFALPASAY